MTGGVGGIMKSSSKGLLQPLSEGLGYHRMKWGSSEFQKIFRLS